MDEIDFESEYHVVAQQYTSLKQEKFKNDELICDHLQFLEGLLSDCTHMNDCIRWDESYFTALHSRLLAWKRTLERHSPLPMAAPSPPQASECEALVSISSLLSLEQQAHSQINNERWKEIVETISMLLNERDELKTLVSTLEKQHEHMKSELEKLRESNRRLVQVHPFQSPTPHLFDYSPFLTVNKQYDVSSTELTTEMQEQLDSYRRYLLSSVKEHPDEREADSMDSSQFPIEFRLPITPIVPAAARSVDSAVAVNRLTQPSSRNDDGALFDDLNLSYNDSRILEESMVLSPPPSHWQSRPPETVSASGEPREINDRIKVESPLSASISSASASSVNSESESKRDEAAAVMDGESKDQQGSHQEEAASSNEFNWTENNEEAPMPPFGLDSPVIQHLLSNWTIDVAKREYLVHWAESLTEESLPENFPMGLQVVGLSAVVKDAFFVMVVPILRDMSLYPLLAYCRKTDPAKIPALKGNVNRMLNEGSISSTLANVDRSPGDDASSDDGDDSEAKGRAADPLGESSPIGDAFGPVDGYYYDIRVKVASRTPDPKKIELAEKRQKQACLRQVRNSRDSKDILHVVPLGDREFRTRSNSSSGSAVAPASNFLADLISSFTTGEVDGGGGSRHSSVDISVTGIDARTKAATPAKANNSVLSAIFGFGGLLGVGSSQPTLSSTQSTSIAINHPIDHAQQVSSEGKSSVRDANPSVAADESVVVAEAPVDSLEATVKPAAPFATGPVISTENRTQMLLYPHLSGSRIAGTDDELTVIPKGKVLSMTPPINTRFENDMNSARSISSSNSSNSPSLSPAPRYTPVAVAAVSATPRALGQAAQSTTAQVTPKSVALAAKLEALRKK